MGDSNWLAALCDEDLAEFGLEVRESLDVAIATRDAAPLEACLHAWRATGEALADPARREVLAGDWGEGDFGEVLMPASASERVSLSPVQAKALTAQVQAQLLKQAKHGRRRGDGA